MWKSAITGAALLKRSGLSARHRMSLREGRGPLEAKARAALSVLHVPIGIARKAFASKQVNVDKKEQEEKRRLDSLPSERNKGVIASRPKRDSLESLALSDVSLGPDNRLSTRPSRVEPDAPDDLTIKAGAEAYQALSSEKRAALDAILELIENHGEAALPDLSKEARHSLNEFRELSSRLSFVATDGGEPVIL